MKELSIRNLFEFFMFYQLYVSYVEGALHAGSCNVQGLTHHKYGHVHFMLWDRTNLRNCTLKCHK